MRVNAFTSGGNVGTLNSSAFWSFEPPNTLANVQAWRLAPPTWPSFSMPMTLSPCWARNAVATIPPPPTPTMTTSASSSHDAGGSTGRMSYNFV